MSALKKAKTAKKEWQRVQKLGQKNVTLMEEIETFYDDFLNEISRSERELLDVTYTLTQNLIGHLSKKTLPEYLRLVLMEWTEELFDELHARPFSDQLSLGELEEKLVAQMDTLAKSEEQKLIKKLKREGYTEEDIAEFQSNVEGFATGAAPDGFDEDLDDDLLDELFREFESAEAPFVDEEDDYFEQIFEAQRQQERQEEQDLNKLLKATPINTLFRKIAKALHPDLEQNEAKKTEKHILMSQVIQARDEKDIPSLLGYYQQYVGELPKGFFEGNFEKLTKILKHQTQKLKQQRHAILSESGVKGAIFDRYKCKTPQATKKSIQQYIKINQNLIRIRNKELQATQSLAKLRPVLEEKHEVSAFDFF